MAQRTTIHLVDDLDESEATETVSFALDGSAYEIDLNDEHASELRDVLGPWIAASRRAGRAAPATRRRTRTAAPATSGEPSAADVRAWARQAGVPVAERGRVHPDVRAAFDKAH